MSRQQAAGSRQPAIQQKVEQVKATLAGFGRVIVAFSGGVDSTLLVKLARDVLGKENVLAVTADSPSLAREDLDEAKRLTRALDVQHLIIHTREVGRPEYRANTDARCYFCKQELFEELEEVAQAQRFPVVLYGAIGDDHLSGRSGHRAALRYGVRAPLQEAGLEKWEVRTLARVLGLANWDRPQNACLSSRIPHGQAVTEDKLRQIEAAESFLRARGFRQVRVRHLGRHARIEVGAEDVARLHDAALRIAVVRAFEAIGFQTVGVNRGGYIEGGADRPADEALLDALSAP